MTERHSGYLVTLGNDLREDDASTIRSALLMVKGVIDVVPVPASIELTMAKQRAKVELGARIIDLVMNEPGK